MLELGCGNGNNLVPMAWTFPESEFVGVDLAGKPIATGQQMIHELGLSNVRLLQGDIAEIDESWGKFDYIIAHGLFSWVPPKVQESILRLSKRLLSPEGMAFVSYNAFPGGHLRSMIREMLLFHLRGERSPSERVQEGKAFLRFLAGGQEKTDEYRLWLKAELGRVLDHSEGHFFHDELAEINQPFYFTQFIERAAGNDLQYVGEADYFEMSDYIFTEPVQQTLQSLGRNRILREQYLDFLKCRCFRQTLLCHRDVKLWNEANPAVIRDFHVSLRGAVANNATGRGENTQFETSKGARFETDFALGKIALGILEKGSPFPIPFRELLDKALQEQTLAGAAVQQAEENLSRFLLELYGAGVVELRTRLPLFASTVSDRPMVNPVARWQIKGGNFCTSVFHTAIQVEDEIGRWLLNAMDGSLNHHQLGDGVWQFLQSKDALNIPPGGETVARKEIEETLQRNLRKLVRLGLLIS